MSGTPSDDCLATMQTFSNQFLEHRPQPGLTLAGSTNFSSHFLSEFCRILAFPIDYSPDAQQSSVHLLIGMVNWLMALITFIIDEVFMLGDLLEDHGDIADDLALALLNERSKYNYHSPR